MIEEKMSIKMYPLTYIGEKSDPSIWYDLNRLAWDYENKTVSVTFSLAINTFKLLLDLLLDKKLVPALWFTERCYDDDGFFAYIKHLPLVKIKSLRIITKAWGTHQYFLPECTIQFQFDKIINQDKDVFNLEIDREHRDFTKLNGKWEVFLAKSDYALEIDDFDLNITFDKNLFPIEFMGAKNFESSVTRDTTFEYFNNNGSNLKLIFRMTQEKECCSIAINSCYIDYNWKDKEIGNYKGIQHNLVIYGAADETANLILSNGSISNAGSLSLAGYISEVPSQPVIMKDKNGNMAIEL